MANEEMYLRKLVDSYEEIIELQKDKIKSLEEELVKIKKSRPIEDPFKDRYDWTKKIEDPEPNKKETEIPKFSYVEVYDKRPEFGSMSNRIKKEKESLQDYIARGGVTELKKTDDIPTPAVPTSIDKTKKERRPRITRRQIFFKSHSDAEYFVSTYADEFEVGKVKHHVKRASEVHYEVKKNTYNDTLFKKGYGWVLIFSMNAVDFEAIEELEHLEKFSTPGERRGASCIRLYHHKEMEGVG